MLAESNVVDIDILNTQSKPNKVQHFVHDAQFSGTNQSTHNIFRFYTINSTRLSHQDSLCFHFSSNNLVALPKFKKKKKKKTVTKMIPGTNSEIDMWAISSPIQTLLVLTLKLPHKPIHSHTLILINHQQKKESKKETA